MRERVHTLLAFATAAILLALAVLQPGFADPDPFYHAKIALMIRDNGFIETFPWFVHTSWANAFVDVHLLYHILLFPFVTVFDPVTGMRVSAFIFGLASLYAIWRFLKAMHAPGAHVLMLSAAMSGLFLHRISMPRAMSLAIVCLLATTWLMFKRRPWAAAASAAVFTYLYHGFPLMCLSFASVVVADAAVEHLHGASIWQSIRSSTRRYAAVGSALLAGVLFATVINPYFPANIAFQWLSVVKIGVANTQTAVQTGTEWAPASPVLLLQTAAPALTVAFIAVVVLVLAATQQKTRHTRESLMQTAACGILAAGYLLLAIRSVRFAEYAIPFLILASGGLLSLSLPFLQQELMPAIQERWMAIRRRTWLVVPLAAGLALVLVGASANATPRTYFRAEQYAFAAAWAREHVEPDATIYTNGWDFPSVLWYLDDTHRYLVGLDPRLMEDADPQVYELWARANTGEEDMRPVLERLRTPAAVIDLRLAHAVRVIERLREAGCAEVGRNEWVVLLSCKTL